jgi:hypothetical protein
LGVDFDVLHLLGVRLFNPIDDFVVQHVRSVFCASEIVAVLVDVVQRGFDHSGDQRHLADRLPSYLIRFYHGSALS